MCVTIHENGGEWVLRLVGDNGDYVGIGALNGKQEAEAVYAVLQGAIEAQETVSQSRVREISPGSEKYWSGFAAAVRQLEVAKLSAILK